MTPIVFINGSKIPYVDLILSGKKKFETRTRNTLKALVGQRVYIAETGKGKPVIRCMATIGEPLKILTNAVWDAFRERTCVPVGSPFDWKPDTKIKWIYFLRDVTPVEPFTPPEGKRHGIVWMEYEGSDK